MAKGLNPKQALFVKEYLIDKNATQAAIRAGYSKKTAHSSGPRLLEHVGVVKAIQDGLASIAAKIEVKAVRAHKTRDEWLHRVEDIAFSDLTEMFAPIKDSSGKTTFKISVGDLKERKLGHLVRKMKVHSNGMLEVELKNDQHALELLAKHKGWVSENLNVKMVDTLTEDDFNEIFNDPETAAAVLKVAVATSNHVGKKPAEGEEK